jgi:hypothetical protein
VNPPNEDELVEFVRGYIALSKGMRFEEKRLFWDAAEPHPVLAPEEAAEPLVAWTAIDGYWKSSRQAMASLRTLCFDFHVNRLGPALALVAFKQRWLAELAGSGPFASAPLAATVRSTWLLRRREAGWRIVCSVEAHIDGVQYFRDLYAERALLPAG